MSADDKAWALRLLVLIGVVFVASTFFAYRELRFVVFGRTTNATVESIEQVRLRRIRATLVHYADADGNPHAGSYDLEVLANEPRKGDTLVVEYVGGSSRRVGRRNGGALMVFLGSGLALAACGAWYWTLYGRPRRTRSRRCAGPRPSATESIPDAAATHRPRWYHRRRVHPSLAPEVSHRWSAR